LVTFFLWASKRKKVTSYYQIQFKKNHELATGSHCRRFNLSSLSRQRRNLEGKKRGAFVATVRINLYTEGEAFLDV
jgi:hypothetical protein